MPMPRLRKAGGASACEATRLGVAYLNQYRTPLWWLQVPGKWRL